MVHPSDDVLQEAFPKAGSRELSEASPTNPRPAWLRWWWAIAGLTLLAYGIFTWLDEHGRSPPPAMNEPVVEQKDPMAAAAGVRVKTVKPTPGSLEHSTTRPGSLEPFEFAKVLCAVSGYYKTRHVDIGDEVKKGQVLAEIDAPERKVEVDQTAAALAQANTQVKQMEARRATAEAKKKAADSAVAQVEADLDRATAQRILREKEYQRIKELNALNAIDAQLVDEKQSETEAAKAAENAARATIQTSRADAMAAAAKVEEAKSDIADADAKVKVAEAAWNKAKVFDDYRKVVSHYNGVVTERNFHRGDFIRGAERGGDTPLFIVARVDLMRVVVEVRDMDVPWITVGDEATIHIDALPGHVFTGKVTRFSHSEDPQSRTMRVEIDLPNPTRRLKQGMYGEVVIKFRARSPGLLIPAMCLAGPLNDRKGSVYVVREGKARLVPVRVAGDDGAHVEVVEGLAAEDDVICGYTGSVSDGAPVSVVNEGNGGKK